MRVLLDTCTVIWATMAPSTLSQTAREIISEPQNEVMVSAASAWEIATKVRLGKLPEAEKLESSFIDVMRIDRKSTRLNSSHYSRSRMPSSA